MFSNIFVSFVSGSLLLAHFANCSVFNYMFDPMNIYSDTSENNININDLRNSIMNDIKYQKKQTEKEKYKTIMEKEKKLKNELTELMKDNILKQIEIENENEKYSKYFEITKKNNRKKIDFDEDEDIINFAESKLNHKNK